VIRFGRCVLMIGTALLVSACSGGLRLGRPASPHEGYVRELRAAGLDASALGRDWIAAGTTSLTRATLAPLPFRETGYFPPDRPSATAYQLDLRRGRRLSIVITFQSAEPGRLFVDLFEAAPAGGEHRRVASLAAGEMTMTYEVERDGAHLLRVQPELLRGGRYTIEQRTLASLPFPLQGLSARAVQSTFGAPRDGSARDHEGIDIFAARGTPAVAVTDGVARTSTNNLGGNVVWLRSAGENRTFYYAHLDRWAFDGQTVVRSGDIVGYVGNTGNARTTSPHLHFGIYERGAIDPLPFLQPDDPDPPPANAQLAEDLGALARVAPLRTALRRGPHASAPTIGQIERGTIAQVEGTSIASMRVRLPDGTTGYVAATALQDADTALERRPLSSGAIVYELPSITSPAAHIAIEVSPVDVIGRFGGFELVRVSDAQTGWVTAD
jgi:murein DD-endopeptidase MepM/ murein hydrolase activator NlpD